MADYGQPDAVTRRVRFFDGQFLQDEDFIDEQKYHLDRARRLGRVLRVTGVAEGLDVVADAGTPNAVRITRGTAIDRDGRYLVLAEDRTLELPAALFNDKQGVRLVALYRQQETDLAATGSQSERRWLEDPQIIAITAEGQATEEVWDDDLPTVLLAQLRLDNRGTVTVDESATELAGLRVQGRIGVGTGADQPAAPARLEVRGGTIRFGDGAGAGELIAGRDYVGVQDGGRNTRLAIAQGSGNVGIGTVTPGDFRLHVNGRTRLGGGTDHRTAAVLSVAPGTVQLDAPGVAGGRLHVDGGTGNVGVGTNNPADYRLNVNGHTRLGGGDTGPNPVLSVASGTVQFDGPNAPGGRLHVDGGTGNVGVATTNPGTFKLHVNGTVRLGGLGADYKAGLAVSLAPGTVQFDGPNAPGGRFHLDGGTGNVGIGSNAPGDWKLYVNGRVRLGGTAEHGANAVVSVAPGTVHFDAPNVVGGRLVIDGTNGRVGIGAPNPRSDIDMGKGLLSGAPNDYMKAQFTMSGGGTITWGGPGQRLKWTNRFIAISAERGPTFRDGYVDIAQPNRPIPAANVYDGAARPADANGVVLNHWDALFAVHPVGGAYNVVDYQIRQYTSGFSAPSNWLLVAVVNGDDGSVKLGTGTTVAARSSSTRNSPIPSGTIVMWSGAADEIPDGWALCNGQNRTPDLQGRFVMAADGSAAQAPGRHGEADGHSHGIDVPAFRVTTDAGGSHTHGFYPSWYKRDFGGGGYSGIDTNGNDVKQSRTASDGNHAHSVYADIAPFESAHWGGGRPRWYALCFIMKLY